MESDCVSPNLYKMLKWPVDGASLSQSATLATSPKPEFINSDFGLVRYHVPLDRQSSRIFHIIFIFLYNSSNTEYENVMVNPNVNEGQLRQSIFVGLQSFSKTVFY